MDLNTLNTIIIRLEQDAGLKIRGVAFDLGNKVFCQQSGFTKGNYFLKHPLSDSRKVYLMPDPPHMLKLLRNHLLEKGFYFPTNLETPPVLKLEERILPQLIERGEYGHLSRKDFYNVLDWNNTELNILHKISRDHIDLPAGMKTNVKAAARTLSRTVSIAMEMMGEPKKAEVVKIINDWFDVVNVRRIFYPYPMKCGFGKHEEQISALIKMKKLTESIYFEGRVRKIPFQQGIICGINSAMDLLKEMNVEGFQYLLTSRMNQDCCENFFSQMRSLGGDDEHPDRLQVLQRARIRLLEKSADDLVPFEKPHTVDETDSGYVTMQEPDSVYATSGIGGEDLGTSRNE